VQTASSTDEYIYDYANRRISTWLPNGAGIEGRIYWGNLLAAFRAQNGDTYFDQKDILGTDRLRMNYAAVAAANYASLPFGDGYTANVSGTYGDQDNNHFAQLDRDAETDTDHAQFRQYYNIWGRWMSPDPYGGSYDITNPQSFNRYAYVNSNPLTFVDPSGLYLGSCYNSHVTLPPENVPYIAL
jgi:RHS repeat-associated protein